MAEPRGSGGSHYRRYAGGDPLAPPVDLAPALEAIGEEVMAGYSPEHAMREFLRRGSGQSPGLDDLAAQVSQRRQELLERHHLGGTLNQVRELLDSAVLQERRQLARDLDDDARFGELQLQNLPPSTAAAVSELSDYTWRSGQARESFEQIKDLLGAEVLEQRFAGMKQALQGSTEADRAAVRAMLDDLNDLLAKHRRGEPTGTAFEQFMAQHGRFFPESPESIDELIDTLAQRAAAAARLLNSMTPEQREELLALSQQAFGSPELTQALAGLDTHLQALRPEQDWSGGEQFSGDQGLGLGDGTGALQEIAELDALSEQLSQAYPGARMDDIDLDALARQLGPEAAVQAHTLTQVEQALKQTGYLHRRPDGQLHLAPRAMRQLGKSLLRDAAARLSGRPGQRDVRQAGTAGEASGGTRAWQFGDTEPWDVTRTVTNAVLRRSGAGGGSVPVEIGMEDVEVTETEARTQAAVALLVDTSFSMAIDGRWVPMKRTALALHTLVRSRFRGDSLELIAFGREARTMQIEELTGLEARWDKGTNLHHALLLAGRHFRRHPHAQPVLLIVTDGEPTAHLEPGGEAYVEYPPHPLTLAYTVRELDQMARLGAQSTFFRLGADPGLARFIDQLARRVQGRVISPELDDLGAAVLDSYLGSRRPRR